MKKKLFILICFTFQLASCQSVYENKSIFLGEYNNKNEIKVYKKGSVVFIKNDSLKQTNQYIAKDFIKVLDSLKLHFIAEGDEPFWQFKLRSSQLLFMKYDSKGFESFKPKFFIDNQSGFNIMFKTANNRAFGLIRRIDNKMNKEMACSLALSDNYYVYEAFITVDGEMFKGCAMIDE